MPSGVALPADSAAGTGSRNATVGGKPAAIPGLRNYADDDGNAPKRRPASASAAFQQPTAAQMKGGFLMQGSGHSRRGMQVHRAHQVCNAADSNLSTSLFLVLLLMFAGSCLAAGCWLQLQLLVHRLNSIPASHCPSTVAMLMGLVDLR